MGKKWLLLLLVIIPIGVFFLIPNEEPIENTSNEDIIVIETIQNTSDVDIVIGEIGSEEQVGIVKGSVYFVGKPCPSSRVGPPCDGPYPNYEVIIYEKDEKNIVNKIMTDDQGNFETQLPVGNYLVFGKNIDFNKVIEIPIVFTIEPEKTKSIEITINEGIR